MIRFGLKSLALALTCTATVAFGQGKFLTAAEVRPILNATKGNWIAVREYEGRDLLYFTHLLAWRCGLSAVRYKINDAENWQDLVLTPCIEDGPTPAAIGPDQVIYVSHQLSSIQSITVELTYDDDGTDLQGFERKSVLIP